VLERLRADPDFQVDLLAFTQRRLIDYVRLYTSAIAETPTQRYLGLLVSQGERVARIPKHVLASYLGVTPVHLSRILGALGLTVAAAMLARWLWQYVWRSR